MGEKDMRKRIYGRKLKRDTDDRKALFRNLMRSLILEGRITTTEAKAKAVKGKLEHLVTQAIKKKDGSINNLKRYFEEDVAQKLISEIAPKLEGRPGGYTRIIRLGGRKKDNAPLVIFEWVEESIVRMSKTTPPKISDKKKPQKNEDEKTPQEDKKPFFSKVWKSKEKEITVKAKETRTRNTKTVRKSVQKEGK